MFQIFSAYRKVKKDKAERRKNALLTVLDIILKDEEAKTIFKNEAEKTKTDNILEIIYLLHEYSYEIKIPFIIYLDWKSTADELDEQLREILRLNYPHVKQSLPDMENDTVDMSVSGKIIFEAYNRVLKEDKLQLGFIETNSDDYMLFVHEEKDKETIESIIRNEIRVRPVGTSVCEYKDTPKK